jgi:hypothetical protein
LVIANDIMSYRRRLEAPLFAAHFPAPLIFISVVHTWWCDYNGLASDPLTTEQRADSDRQLVSFTFPAIHQLLLQCSDKRVAILCQPYPDRCRYRGGARINISTLTAQLVKEELDEFFAEEPNSSALRSRVTVLAAPLRELACMGTYFYSIRH